MVKENRRKDGETKQGTTVGVGEIEVCLCLVYGGPAGYNGGTQGVEVCGMNKDGFLQFIFHGDSLL